MENKQQLRLLLQRLQNDTLTRDELKIFRDILDRHGNEDEITEILQEYWKQEHTRKLNGHYDKWSLGGKYFYILHKN